ncbi:MAG: hypothetical protein P8J14_06530, partial [Emcibacteraceae bacterium]|nr:hypothetical protein [Emcibacteraceae bacterium]
KEGKAFTLSTQSSKKYLDGLQKFLKKEIPILKVPGEILGEAPKKHKSNDAPKKHHKNDASNKNQSNEAPEKNHKRQEKPKNDKTSEVKTAKPDVKPVNQENNKGNNRKPVVGLGDHVPDFLTR